MNHNDRFIQVETVWEVGKHPLLPPYLPDPPTLEPLLALFDFLKIQVPLRRPAQWHDDMSDCPMPWAADNARRKSRIALSFDGWVGHIEVPDQAPTWHYDPGAYAWARAFAMMGDDMSEYADGQMDYLAHPNRPHPLPVGWSADKRNGYNVAKALASSPQPIPGPPGPVEFQLP